LDEILNHDWSRLNNNMNIIMDFHAAPRQWGCLSEDVSPSWQSAARLKLRENTLWEGESKSLHLDNEPMLSRWCNSLDNEMDCVVTQNPHTALGHRLAIVLRQRSFRRTQNRIRQ
jgi:hypothetical protein